MRLNIDLNKELDIRIFSFPMRYQPTDLPNRSFVSEKWHQYYLRSMQIILQATHGIVSGEPAFFEEASGENQERFEELLLLPQHYLFNRFWYRYYEGRAELDEFQGLNFLRYQLLSAKNWQLYCRQLTPRGSRD
ncbi:MAG: hypothetical protein IPJ25_11045 [Rhodocyclaceae bacterium]|nr:hypothetical protein [Rhodocyclaceae bacterium]